MDGGIEGGKSKWSVSRISFSLFKYRSNLKHCKERKRERKNRELERKKNKLNGKEK